MNLIYFRYKQIIFYTLYLSYWIIHILTFCTCFAYFTNLPEIQVYENLTIGTVIISDLRNLLGVPKSSYIKLGPGSLTQYFRLDNITGNVHSISSVDLETSNLCSAENSCCPDYQHEQAPNELLHNNQYTENELNYYYPEDLSNNLDYMRENEVSQHTYQCKLTAFILASIDNVMQISPIAKLHVNIIDLNDNYPQFNKFLDYQTNYRSESIYLSYFEGSLGVNMKHELPRAFDADFSPTNRVKNYWIEWDNSNYRATDNLHQSSVSKFSTFSSKSTMTYTNGQIWSKLGPFRLIYEKSVGNLIIQLDHELDREEQSIYKLRLIAQDGGDLRGSIQLIIEVDDVNEFPPMFIDADHDSKMENSHLLLSHTTQEVFKKQYRLKESLDIGSRIGQLKAIDRDLSMLSNESTNQITYHFSSNQMNWDATNVFHLDSQSGILTLKHSLDYESVKNYRLTIIATDGIKNEKETLKSFISTKSTIKKSSQIIHSATALVDIIVLDVNDNPPVILFDNDYITANKQNKIATSSKTLNITSKSHEIWIKENIPIGTPIVYFNVIDHDTGQNGRISCQLLNSTEIFSIHKLSDLYRIETQSLLDRESIDQYTVMIQCHDMGEPMLYNTKSLIIHLIDTNDSPPSFPLNVYHFHVLENSNPGTPIQPVSNAYPTFISATDPDLNSTLTYRLEPSELQPLNNQSDNNNNNNNVNFRNPLLDYQLFSIDPINGQIFTQGELDREKKSSLEFYVCVNDRLYSACAKVIVDLDDTNDNAPSFKHDTYVISLEENKQYDEPIILFSVYDLDSNNQGFKFNIWIDSNKPPEQNNAMLMQQYQNENSTQSQYNNKSIDLKAHDNLVRKHFTLKDNALYLLHSLDREQCTDYHFYVQVQDVHRNLAHFNNTPQFNAYLTSQTEIFIHVTDTNDNLPIFIFPNATTSSGNRLITSCREMIGSSIGQIQAYDPDQGLNGTIIYSLIMPSLKTQSLFYLNNISGELFVHTDRLVEYCGKNITLIISINDQGSLTSKIQRSSPMEHLIIQLDDIPIKVKSSSSSSIISQEQNHQLKQKWTLNPTSLSDSNLLISTSSNHNNDNTSTFTTKIILIITLGSSTIFLIGLLIISTILILYSKSKRRKLLFALKNLQLKENIHKIQYGANHTTNEHLICMDCKQKELSKMLFPPAATATVNNNNNNDYSTKTSEHYPTSMLKPKSINEEEVVDANVDHQHPPHSEQGNVRIHLHSYSPYTTYGLRHCIHDSNSVNIPEFKDDNINDHKQQNTVYPTSHLHDSNFDNHCLLGQSPSLLSTLSLSPSQQQKRQLPTLSSSFRREGQPSCNRDSGNNCLITSGCSILNCEETEHSSALRTISQPRNDQVTPISVKLNIQSHCDTLRKHLDHHDQGILNGSQKIFENNEKCNITQDYQRINKCGYEKPPLCRPPSRSLLNNCNNNNALSHSAQKTQHLQDKSNSPIQMPKTVSFIPPMPCFDNYPLKRTLDHINTSNNNTNNNNKHFMDSFILKSTSGTYELCGHQHLCQFKSHPNISVCTIADIDDLRLNDKPNISQTNQTINPQLSPYGRRNFLHKKNQLPLPPPLPHRFLTPPCTRRLIQSNCHMKPLPLNENNEGYKMFSMEKQCNCTLANANKPPTSPKFSNQGLSFMTEDRNITGKHVASIGMNTSDADNQERNNNIHETSDETSNILCCDYMSNYESEICSQCQLINFRNSPTPVLEVTPRSTTVAMKSALNDCTIMTICTTDPTHSTHSVISSSDSSYYTKNNCPLFNITNVKNNQHNEYMHQLDYSTNSLTNIRDLFNSCV
ncbi:unnamed protein product [Schistosoma turkestanicum]|nr:unnamed protein product [Schistosoma turkestanicum]